MTIISIILPFVLFGPAIERLPGVGFKDEYDPDIKAVTSVLLSSNSFVRSRRNTVMDLPEEEQTKINSIITLNIKSRTMVNSTTVLHNDTYVSSVSCNTEVEVQASTETTFPGEVMNVSSKSTFKISTIGSVNTTVLPSNETNEKIKRSVISVEVSKIAGETTSKGIGSLEKIATFSAVIGSETVAYIESETMDLDNEDIESSIYASTKAEYSDLSVDWFEKTQPDKYTGTHTLVEFSTSAATNTKVSEDDLVLVNIKANIMEVSSTNSNKYTLSSGMGENLTANSSRSAMINVDSAIATTRKGTAAPSQFTAAAHSHLSRQSVDEFNSSTAIEKLEMGGTHSRTTTLDNCETEIAARGFLDLLVGVCTDGICD